MENLKPFLATITKTDTATTVAASVMMTVCTLAMFLTWGMLAVAGFAAPKGVVRMAAAALPAEAPAPPFLRGDADGNAVVEITDAVYLLRYLFQGAQDPPCHDAADADDNGTLDLTDAIYTLRYLFQGGASPPAPGPNVPGSDPTPDSLTCTPIQLVVRSLPEDFSVRLVPADSAVEGGGEGGFDPTREVPLGTLRMEARGAAMKVNRIAFIGRKTNTNIPPGAWHQISSFQMYVDGRHVTDIVAPSSADQPTLDEPELAVFQIDRTINQVLIPRDGAVDVRLSAYVPWVELDSKAVSGQGIQLVIDRPNQIEVVTQDGANVPITVDVSGVDMPRSIIYQNVPRLKLNDELGFEGVGDGRLSAGAVAGKDLYRFTIQTIGNPQSPANAPGVGLHQVAFAIRRSSAVLVSNPVLMAGDPFMTVALGEPVSAGEYDLYRFTIERPSNLPIGRTIPFDQAMKFTLQGDVDCTLPCPGDAFLEVYFLGDGDFPTVYPAAAAVVGQEVCLGACPNGSGNFVWTDYSLNFLLAESEPRLLELPQWTNGYLVRTAQGTLPKLSKPVRFSR